MHKYRFLEQFFNLPRYKFEKHKIKNTTKHKQCVSSVINKDHYLATTLPYKTTWYSSIKFIYFYLVERSMSYWFFRLKNVKVTQENSLHVTMFAPKLANVLIQRLIRWEANEIAYKARVVPHPHAKQYLIPSRYTNKLTNKSPPPSESMENLFYFFALALGHCIFYST